MSEGQTLDSLSIVTYDTYLEFVVIEMWQFSFDELRDHS